MTGSQEYSYSNRHLNGNVSYTGRFGGVRRSRTKLKFRPNVTPFRELSDCKNFILERSQSALDGGYDDKRSFLNQLDCLIRETLPDSLNDPSFFEELCLLALDLRVENDMERAEALQLIYHIMTVYQNSHLKRLIQFSAAQQDGKKYAFPKSIMQPIIAVALSTICSAKIRDPSGPQERVAIDLTKDSLDLGCLEVFLEFCVLEPELILDMAGTDWIVRILTGSNSISPRVATVVSRILVAWLDQPKLRLKGQLHLVLEQIFAPLIEFGFFQKNLSATEHGERIVESAMISFGHSFLCILRSWSGLLSCAAIGPTSSAIASAPLRLLEYLGLGTVDDSNLLRIRNMVVDICCEFLDLPYASKNFEDWDSALEYYSSLVVPDEFSDSLKDDFVLAQSDMCIANNEECSQHVDLLTSFRSLAALILINAGLLQTPTVMPSSWRTTILSMPTLFQSACESIAQSKAAAATHGYYDSNQADRFTFLYSGNAAMVLHRFDMLYKASISNAVAEPPIDSNYSLFLCPPEPLTSPFQSSLDTSLPSILNEVSSGDGSEINWGAAALLFSRLPAEVKETEKSFCLDDVLDLFEKILTVMSPRSSAHTFWNADKFPLVVARIAITIGLELGSTEDKFLQALTRYATDVCDALNEVSSGSDVFSTRNLVDGGSMYYFSLIGVMSSHANGVVPLEKSGILQL
ncbi:hypothetical protein NECAME_06642 [Necator americanus]|uniref:Rapamycin-insensitive companion of mTOR N-terminal domain-containing protein n=1 Tax=Necator americanus TaxID=51031 RepID=W2TSW0_NECAM|nr:hypothetical protein NECAME_06642 [Necator americanus]ETN84838.1 hypothetical protein NECAME_06642 [Necator americanus]